ncbi:MAG: LemA family protein [Paracraurococcus sp.]
MTTTLLIVAAIILLPILWAILTYNALVRRRTIVDEAWSGIDAQLKRRADLIPNVIETVRGYVAHERGTLDELTRLRIGAPPAAVAARASAEQEVSAALGRVLAVAEGYPDLKASANFQALQAALAELEDQIQLARRFYNGAVRDLNVTVGQFPSNLIARQGGFESAEFFTLENAGDRALPKVSFG